MSLPHYLENVRYYLNYLEGINKSNTNIEEIGQVIRKRYLLLLIKALVDKQLSMSNLSQTDIEALKKELDTYYAILMQLSAEIDNQKKLEEEKNKRKQTLFWGNKTEADVTDTAITDSCFSEVSIAEGNLEIITPDIEELIKHIEMLPEKEKADLAKLPFKIGRFKKNNDNKLIWLIQLNTNKELIIFQEIIQKMNLQQSNNIKLYYNENYLDFSKEILLSITIS